MENRFISHRTVEVSSFEAYLEEAFPVGMVRYDEIRSTEIRECENRAKAFPYSVVLKVAYPELDFASRWCWKQFGPAQGACNQASSEYPSCKEQNSHIHEGCWRSDWLEKTDYNFGCNQWSFSNSNHRDQFLGFIPQINWGENYPK